MLTFLAATLGVMSVPMLGLLPHAHTITGNGARTNGTLARHLGGLALTLERYAEAALAEHAAA